MDSIDTAAAESFQDIRSALLTGPWNTGQLGEKGYVVSEVVNASANSTKDAIKRYTDRYLQQRTIGRTTQDFPFNPSFLPSELHKAVGLSAQPKRENGDTKPDRLSRVERLAGIDDDEPGEKPKEEQPNDDENDNDENAEEIEDEFEELDDDDYNAEKYFDDGDDYGDGDDGDGEAAY